jgi:predicted permease
MIANYFRSAWRNIKRHSIHSFINIGGLSLGIACLILIFSLIKYHLSFDRFHADNDRIYRVVTEFHEDKIRLNTGVPSPLGEAFSHDFAVAEKVARIANLGKRVISTSGERKFEEEVAFADPSFFEVMNFPLAAGNKTGLLKAPFTAAITQRTAAKYFGTADPIGKIIHLDDSLQFTVTAILKDLPVNTDFRPEVYVPFDNLQNHSPWLVEKDWWLSVNKDMQCFVLLKPGVRAADVDNKVLTAISKQHYDQQMAALFQFKLQPLSDIHFNAELRGVIDQKSLWALAFIGLLLIITSCINFVNLNIAQALGRSKEIGLRKVLGSQRGQLFLQFMIETGLTVLIAMLLAIAISLLALPYINHLFDVQLSVSNTHDIYLLLFLPLLFVMIVFLSGVYPGVIIAGFQPIQALKNKVMQHKAGGMPIRKGLVVTQFAISQLLIIGTIVIANQMRYSMKSDPGFRKDAILMLPMPEHNAPKINTLRSLFTQIPGVEKITFCGNAPAAAVTPSTGIKFDSRKDNEKFSIYYKAADPEYLSTFDIPLLAGRNLYPSDSIREFLINETAVKKLQLASNEEALGKKAVINGSTGLIVGVVKDFHNRSFHEPIDAVYLTTSNEHYFNCAVKVNMNNYASIAPLLEKAWQEAFPQQIYTYSFLDERLAQFYKSDNMILRLIRLFTIISITIGCIGLYGLVSFMATRRTKEMGIRKALGANVENIVWLFGKEFIYMLLIAFVIAAPLAWYMMSRWLDTFAYRIHFGAGIFVLAILISLAVAILTVGYKSMQTALMNPVKSLRSE